MSHVVVADFINDELACAFDSKYGVAIGVVNPDSVSGVIKLSDGYWDLNPHLLTHRCRVFRRPLPWFDSGQLIAEQFAVAGVAATGATPNGVLCSPSAQ